ncbi:hypothetical protein ABLE93_24970 [Xanthobacter sp. KR7-65]|uniref:hypothetical protein n=1 Tax=Xanthobacter sp. KR7-65 TaxID=3156612 RepID=UPI0032B4E506
MRLRLVAAIAVLLLGAAAAAKESCPERPPCRGCGCKGGPGYRGPDGRCVGFADLARVCGSPPTARCVFENAPGTGANRACATGAAQPEGAPPPPR